MQYTTLPFPLSGRSVALTKEGIQARMYAVGIQVKQHRENSYTHSSVCFIASSTTLLSKSPPWKQRIVTRTIVIRHTFVHSPSYWPNCTRFTWFEAGGLNGCPANRIQRLVGEVIFLLCLKLPASHQTCRWILIHPSAKQKVNELNSTCLYEYNCRRTVSFWMIQVERCVENCFTHCVTLLESFSSLWPFPVCTHCII